jgi:hypothetical protein
MSNSPFEAAAAAAITVFNTEFAAEQFVMIPDELHESLGRYSVAAGISPVEDIVRESNAVVQETWMEASLFDLWTQEISPDTVVDPFVIAGYAERYREALRVSNATDPGTGQVWFFEVRRTRYPRDPTGNKTRFVMTIKAWGNNAALVETSA